MLKLNILSKKNNFKVQVESASLNRLSSSLMKNDNHNFYHFKNVTKIIFKILIHVNTKELKYQYFVIKQDSILKTSAFKLFNIYTVPINFSVLFMCIQTDPN